MNWLHQIKYSDICVIIFVTIEHFLNYLFNYWFGLLAFFGGFFFFRITVSNLGKVHNLYFFVCLAGPRTVLCTKKMLSEFRCLGSQSSNLLWMCSLWNIGRIPKCPQSQFFSL